MQHLLLGLALVAATASAEPATVGTTTSDPSVKSVESLAAIQSVPQLGHVAVDGRIAVLRNLQVELGGWNLFDDTRAGTFLRGGWAGVRWRVWESDGIGIGLAGRVLVGQRRDANDAVTGAWLQSGSRIRMFSWFHVLPDFEVSVFGPLFQARVANEFRFLLRDFRIGGHGGAQIQVREGVWKVMPLAELSAGWRKHFAPLDFDVSAGLALAMDPSALVGHPVFETVQTELKPWAFLRFAFIPN